MRGIQLQLSQTQKLRLHKALEQLESLSSKVNCDASVTIADSIPVNHEDGVLKEHGTADLDGEVVATLCGIVERVNKLVYVCALRSRYKPEVGDIVIGRVVEVAQERWRLDINYSQNAYLMFSAMNMPDGVQRRRTALDELNMCCIFEEADVICAEVCGFQHDGLHLQAKSKNTESLPANVHSVVSWGNPPGIQQQQGVVASGATLSPVKSSDISSSGLPFKLRGSPSVRNNDISNSRASKCLRMLCFRSTKPKTWRNLSVSG